jgi:hypothetical protein
VEVAPPARKSTEESIVAGLIPRYTFRMRNSFRSAVLVLGVILAGCECNPPIVNPGDDGGAGDGGGVTGGGGGGDDDGGTGGGSGGGGGGGGGMMMSTDGGCGLVTCASMGANCGPIGDGCGNLLNCGSCTLPQTCGGGGTPSVCGGDAGCIPVTCQQLGAECGPMADRCGNLMNCGSCALPEICGGGGIPGRCGLLGSNVNDAGMCVPTTCAIAGASCGIIGDGCGGTINCGTCAMGKLCGGGGVPYQCGGGATCTPATCASLGATCGQVGDGCGNILNCGPACPAPQTCGGGGVPNVCGGGSVCVPKTCAQLNATCGLVGDGCGNILNCNTVTCTGGQACGAGGVPNQCGGQVTCVPKTTCAQANANCGPTSDGCGGILQCGTCTVAGQTCGGGGVANQCGAPPACVPKTCAQQGANCGPVSDGCGGLTANCGTCSGIDICGGAGTPSVCGSVAPDAGACTNLCLNQMQCPGVDGGTTLTGVVYAPTAQDAGYGAPDPIPGALIYIPNSAVGSLEGDGGVTCDQCTDGVSGSPLVSTNSATNGSFTLKNVPCGAGVQVPVVIQLGKWRRQITVPAPACCTNTALTPEQTRLPRKQAEGHPNDNIPKIAVVTGSADSIECVLPKIGIASDQYSQSTGTGRVKFYRDNGAQFTGGGTTGASTLFNSLAEMRKFDMIILDCVGGEQLKTLAQRRNLEDYANSGGRVFASHYAYVWLAPTATNNGNSVNCTQANPACTFPQSGTWTPVQNNPPNQDAKIDISVPKTQTFAEWVQLVNAQAATSTPAVPRIRINTVRNDLSTLNNPPSQRWVYGLAANGTTEVPFQFTFNAPVSASAANQCGRVLFSDFHVINASSGNATWPTHCSVSPMTPQEKVFEYLIFDLSSCIKPDVPPPQMCTPKTCDEVGVSCGPAADGCGGTLNCGTCTAPATCGGGGTPGRCGTPCTPRTCAQLGANCGTQGDGCGGTITCGTCPSGQTCGGGGTPNVCGGGMCVPKTCAQLGVMCGLQGDGCGGQLNCGACPTGQTCGGGGVPGQCGGASCTALTCAQQNYNCGMQGDGCGGTLNCGTCTLPQTCGGGGLPGVCGGGGVCTPRTCLMQGFNCGLAGDGCGNQINCGPCPMGQVCGAQGPNLCGATACTPLSCSDQGIGCGPAGDGCGNIIQCGACPMGQTCGGAGVPGQCGVRPCTPTTCSNVGANCGQIGDGCGGTLNCGVCGPQESCGGGGIANVCGSLG